MAAISPQKCVVRSFFCLVLFYFAIVLVHFLVVHTLHNLNQSVNINIDVHRSMDILWQNPSHSRRLTSISIPVLSLPVFFYLSLLSLFFTLSDSFASPSHQFSSLTLTHTKMCYHTQCTITVGHGHKHRYCISSCQFECMEFTDFLQKCALAISSHQQPIHTLNVQSKVAKLMAGG